MPLPLFFLKVVTRFGALLDLYRIQVESDAVVCEFVDLITSMAMMRIDDVTICQVYYHLV